MVGRKQIRSCKARIWDPHSGKLLAMWCHGCKRHVASIASSFAPSAVRSGTLWCRVHAALRRAEKKKKTAPTTVKPVGGSLQPTPFKLLTYHEKFQEGNKDENPNTIVAPLGAPRILNNWPAAMERALITKGGRIPLPLQGARGALHTKGDDPAPPGLVTKGTRMMPRRRDRAPETSCGAAPTQSCHKRAKAGEQDDREEFILPPAAHKDEATATPTRSPTRPPPSPCRPQETPSCSPPDGAFAATRAPSPPPPQRSTAAAEPKARSEMLEGVNWSIIGPPSAERLMEKEEQEDAEEERLARALCGLH